MWRRLSALRWPQHIPIVGDSGIHHKALDRVVGSLRGRLPAPFFKEGWGNAEVPREFLAWLRTFEASSRFQRNAQGEEMLPKLPREIDVELRPYVQISQTMMERDGARLMEGIFESPTYEIHSLLPEESRVSRFLMVLPKELQGTDWGGFQGKDSLLTTRKAVVTPATPAKFLPCALLLPGTGDHGYSRRLQCVSLPLAQQGIASVILESPFYGSRKPKGQFGSKLKRVSDLPVLGRATIEESASILHWLHSHGVGPLVVSGVSMGGLHAAMIASLFPIGLGVVSWCAPPSAGPVFAEGLLAKYCAWKNLQKDAERLDLISYLGIFMNSTSSQQQQRSVQELMDLFLKITDIGYFPAPVSPDKAIIVLAKNDLYVQYDKAAARWLEMQQSKWKGAEIRWSNGGHVSESLFSLNEMVRCIAQVAESMKLKTNPST